MEAKTPHKMAYNRGYGFEEISWQEGCKLLSRVNPDLANVIYEIKPSDNHTFLKVSYQFGDPIILKDGAYLPTIDGQGISFNDKSFSPDFRSRFGFDPKISNPVGIILNKYSECYNHYNERDMPQAILSPGDIFGLSRPLNNINPILDEPISPFFTWELKAGVRSLVMAAKINDGKQHIRLKKLSNLKCDKPDTYQGHWDVFREIAIRNNSNWRLEILFFSNSWFESLKNREWLALFAYLSQARIRSHKIWHNNQTWVGNLNEVEILHHLKGYPSYALDTARHLFAIAANSAPAFKPAIDDSGAPIKLIQEAYINNYQLKYVPIIMEINKFTKGSQPLYYMLNYPILAQANPEAKHRSIIILLSQIQEITNRIQSGILNNSANITFPALYKAASEVEFTYFHNEPNGYKNISKLIELADKDDRFMNELTGTFPEHSPFLNGCIRIALKD